MDPAPAAPVKITALYRYAAGLLEPKDQQEKKKLIKEKRREKWEK